jgi:WhiB family redox-sensing transcriptional regulator
MTEKSHEQYEGSGIDLETEANIAEYCLEDFNWQDLAECKTVDTSLFFPERGASTKEAKAICSDCIVREDCLEYALAHEKHGIWGGMSERERRRVRKARTLHAAQYITGVTIDT